MAELTLPVTFSEGLRCHHMLRAALGAAEFRERSRTKGRPRELARRPMLKWWADFIASAGETTTYTTRRAPRSVERTMKWLKCYVLPTLGSMHAAEPERVEEILGRIGAFTELRRADHRSWSRDYLAHRAHCIDPDEAEAWEEWRHNRRYAARTE